MVLNQGRTLVLRNSIFNTIGHSWRWTHGGGKVAQQSSGGNVGTVVVVDVMTKWWNYSKDAK